MMKKASAAGVPAEAVAEKVAEQGGQESTRVADGGGPRSDGRRDTSAMGGSKNTTDPESRKREKEVKRQMYEAGLQAYLRHAHWRVPLESHPNPSALHPNPSALQAARSSTTPFQTPI